MKRSSLLSVVCLVCLFAVLAGPVAAQRREIRIPDILGYRTLKCDFHMHTVFSDGLVWPTVRVDEAWREGLDAICISDHIEYQPHKADIPTNHNRPYEIAMERAKKAGLLLIRGTEITRETPPGHFNAIFLEDINPLDTKEFLDVMKAARAQEAFVWWNHPGWKARGDENYIFPIHEELRSGGLIQGVEFSNGRGYWAAAHAWALKHNLTFMGNSDIHAPADNDQINPANHRTMTLVLAREKTIPAIREALFDRRTVVWQGNTLIGRREYLEALFMASIEVDQPHHRYQDTATISITNTSDVDFECQRTGTVGPEKVVLPAGERAQFRVTVNENGWAHLAYTITNLLTAPGKGLDVEYMLYAE